MKTKKLTILHQMWKCRQAYLFLLPLFIGLLIFCYYPPIYGIGLAFFSKKSYGATTFVGFDNFKTLFQDEVFLQSFSTMFKIMIPKLIIGITVPLIMAELIFAVSSKKSQGIYRVLILLPIIAPGVVGLLIWRNIYVPNEGLFTLIVKGLGFAPKDAFLDWLGDPKLVIFAIIMIGFPWIGGTSVLIYMSGIMNISTEVIEASRLDGASTFRRIFEIDLPLLIGQIRYFLIFGIIGGFQDYGIQVALTDGGPGFSTYVPGFHMFKQAFTHDNFGYASAIGTVLFLIIAVVSALAFKFIKSKAAD